METPTSSPSASDSQTRKRKGRNSELRKEQNRIASRAYRQKRRQKLALLDEILKDSQTDSMSSTSDETEFNPMTPALEFRVPDTPRGGSRHSSHSPAPFYMSPVPAPSPMAAGGIQPLPSNAPSRDTETYVNYPAFGGYGHENDQMGSHHAEYTGVGMSTGYGSPIPSGPIMSPAPLYPYEEEFAGDAFGVYPLPDGSIPGYPATSEYDSNMIQALQSLSRLNNDQQQTVMAYLQKRSFMQPAMAGHTYSLGYGGGHVPIPRPSPAPRDEVTR